MNANKDKLFSLRLDRFTPIYLGGLILLLALICIFFPKATEAEGNASLYLFPGSKTFRVADTFSIEVKVDTADLPINASQTIIYFPIDKLEVLGFSKSDSIFTLWPEEPAFSNSSGEISFSGGVPHPGFTGTGNIITINFRAENEGVANLSLGEAQVLADDGKGTNILVFVKEAKYSIQETTLPEIKTEAIPGQVPSPSQISSSTHPRQEEWYSNNSPQFQWGLSPDIIGVSFLLDKDPDTSPDTHPEGRVQSKACQDIKDGIWYFHLRLENETGWGAVSHYKVKIDTYAPQFFEIIIDNEGDPTNPRPNLYFESGDDTSGVEYYKLKVGEESFSDLMLAQANPFSMSFQAPGRRSIVARAMDMAGNGVEVKTEINVEPIDSPQITVLPGRYISGEETLYLEGTSLPEVEIMIFLEKDGKKVKTWQTLSNSQGEWSFSTKELIKSDTYYLSVQAKDQRGAISYPSESYKIEVLLSGLSLGPLIVSFRELVLLLILVLCLGIITAAYFIWKGRQIKKNLRKETQEAEEGVHQVFATLKEEIEDEIEFMDSQPGFTQEEKKACQTLIKTLKKAEESVSKEIKDILEELK